MAKKAKPSASGKKGPISPESKSPITDVRSFWDSHPCEGDWDSPEGLIHFRYLREPYLPKIIDENVPSGCKVLEVGCGQGVDLVMLARRSKQVTAIDLTPAAVARSKKLLKHFNLNGEVLQGNAEHLDFKDNSFDVVYSYGVLHHTDGTQAAIEEVYRVLKPGGKAVIMLYRSPSPTFISVKFARALTYPFRERISAFLSTDRFKNSALGTSMSEAFGVPIIKGYTRSQVRRMFSRFSQLSISRYQTGFTRLRLLNEHNPRALALIDWLEDKTRNTLGFFNVIVAIK